MLEQTLQRLEFDKIVQLLAGFTQTDPGFDRALALRPLPSDNDVVTALDEVDELVRLLETGVSPPINGLYDLGPVFNSLTVTGSCLDSESFLLVLSSLETMDAVRIFHWETGPSGDLTPDIDDAVVCKAGGEDSFDCR